MRSCRTLLSATALLALLHLPVAAQQVTAPGAAHPSSQTLPMPMPLAFADRAASGEALVNAWFGLLALEPVDGLSLIHI